MIEEIANEDIEKTAKSTKSQEKPIEAVKNMETIIKSNKGNMLRLAQQGQIFEKFKTNENFIDMIKEFGISKSTVLFKNIICKICK